MSVYDHVTLLRALENHKLRLSAKYFNMLQFAYTLYIHMCDYITISLFEEILFVIISLYYLSDNILILETRTI